MAKNTNTKTKTKRAIAAAIFTRMTGRKTPASRAQILAAFQEKAGLTVAGSGTYYQNFKSGKWAV